MTPVLNKGPQTTLITFETELLIDLIGCAATTTDPMYQPAQLELIAELKASKDISGIKKLKVERAKIEVQHEQSQAQEFEKQFTCENFLDKVTINSLLKCRVPLLNQP